MSVTIRDYPCLPEFVLELFLTSILFIKILINTLNQLKSKKYLIYLFSQKYKKESEKSLPFNDEILVNFPDC